MALAEGRYLSLESAGKTIVVVGIGAAATLEAGSGAAALTVGLVTVSLLLLDSEELEVVLEPEVLFEPPKEGRLAGNRIMLEFVAAEDGL